MGGGGKPGKRGGAGKGAGKQVGKSGKSNTGKGKGAGKQVGKSGKSNTGKGKGATPNTDQGKNKDPAGAGKAAGKGKGGTNDGLTRKQRKGKGKGKGDAKLKPAATVSKKESKKDRRAARRNQAQKTDHVDPLANLSRWERRRQHFKETAKELKRKHAEDSSVTETKKSKKRLRSEMAKAKALTCKNKHAMEKRSTNPVGYANQAACDVCGLENMPKKRKFFFHCSFCKWDICPQCSEDRLSPQESRKREGSALPSSGVRKKRALSQPVVGDGSGFTRARREIWLPTDSSAVNRAPANIEVVNSWAEGVPV